MIGRRAASRWLYRRIGYEPEAARYMALLAADYLEDNEPMPVEMRAWLADALRAMGDVKAKANGEPVETTRTATLGRALGIMKRQGSPRFVDRLFIRMGLPAVASGEKSESAFAIEVGQRFRASLNTARNHIRREMAFTPGVEAHEWIDGFAGSQDCRLHNE